LNIINSCLLLQLTLILFIDGSTKEHLLIMEYANGGNLRNYFKHKFSKLDWNDKIKLAYQITEAIKYLHDEDILHQNLYSKNILIHQEEAKIMLDITKDDSEISYKDPKLLKDYSYECDKKSNIYSLGVLMWELSSGRPPFIGESESVLKYSLIGGRREDPVPDTPNKYLKLYKSCWDHEPNKRPSIWQVFNKLVELGRAMNIQDFQDIKCDNDDMQSKNN
jgi:serine/threonine protein kinase